MLFPSQQWLDEYRRRINESPDYHRAAAGWQRPLLYHLQAERGGPLSADSYLWLDLRDGRCAGALVLDPDDARVMRTEYALSAPYSRCQLIVTGQLDPMRAIMTGKLRLRGSVPTLVRYSSASNALVAIAQQIPTEFLASQG